MSQANFKSLSPDEMNSLMPGFDFSAVVTSNDLGAVYFANQRSLDRQVAVKVFSPALGEDPEFRKSFDHASKLVAGLRHPNLIGILDSGHAGEMSFWVMEFVPGKSLARSTRGNVIEFGQSMLLIEGICEGLSAAHEAGLVHGNLDTLSVLLNQQAAPKIGNFGLGRPVHTALEADVRTHSFAPEVITKSGPATKRSDVFSLGAIFYELIAGRPYEPDAAPPSKLTGCRPEIDEVLKKATDPVPVNRMADARAFLVALKEAAEGRKTRTLEAASPRSAASPKTEGVSQTGSARVEKVGFDWKILPKVALIIVLLFAVHLTWEARKTARENRERQNREILAKAEADKEKARAAAAALRAREVAEADLRNSARPVLPEIDRMVETPEESLPRLRSALVSGRRSEMPAGSVRKGDSDYFFNSRPMTWPEAARFAEEHGGHLATPDADLGWLADEATKGRAVWLGAGLAGAADSWTLVDGKPWSPETRPSGSGRYLVMDENGAFISSDGGTLRPSVIQWRTDGTNPGTLAGQLAATRSSLENEAPVYPPGTVARGGCHLLHVPLPVNWREAGELAESGGGHLLVPSDAGEFALLGEVTGRLEAQDGIWLGGSLEGDLWKWTTGEPWKTAEWIKGAEAPEAGAALVLLPGKGWDSLDRDDEASGFIIEWSDDSKAAVSGETDGPGVAVAELNAKVKELILTAENKRREALAANIKKLSWDLDAFLRGLKKSGQDQWGSHVGMLKDCVKDDRFLTGEIEPRGIAVSPEMAKLVIYHTKKQDEIDARFVEEVGKIRDAFVVKLSEIRDAAVAAGQLKISTDSSETIDQAADLVSWVETFGISLPQDSAAPEE